MLKTRFSLIICVLCILFHKLSAQYDSTGTDFPHGKPIIRIFADVYHELPGGGRAKAFEVRRVYLGYSCIINDHYSAEVKLDIGSPDDISEYSLLRRYAYFKTAALYWKKGLWNIHAGIIDTEHYKLQEKYWGHRYIYKSMQDEHRFGPKADLGASVVFTPIRQLSFDASLMNGEGYSNLQRDNAFKYSAGISWYPASSVIIRGYYDHTVKDIIQSTLSTFLGCQYRKITAGAEYNRKFNSGFNPNHDQNGLSFYMAYDINERFELFGRFDRLSSTIPPEYSEPWNLVDDGSAVITGIQFHPVDQVKLALNYQDWVPYAANTDNSRFLFLNLEVSL